MRLVSNWAKFPETVVQLTIYTREGVRSRDYLTVGGGGGRVGVGGALVYICFFVLKQ